MRVRALAFEDPVQSTEQEAEKATMIKVEGECQVEGEGEGLRVKG